MMSLKFCVVALITSKSIFFFCRKFYDAATNKSVLRMMRDVAIFGLASTALYMYITTSLPLIGGLMITAYLALRSNATMDVFFKTVGRDLKYVVKARCLSETEH